MRLPGIPTILIREAAEQVDARALAGCGGVVCDYTLGIGREQVAGKRTPSGIGDQGALRTGRRRSAAGAHADDLSRQRTLAAVVAARTGDRGRRDGCASAQPRTLLR